MVSVDATMPTALSTLLLTSALCGMAVRSYLPRGRNTIVDNIQDVDNDVPDSDLAGLVS